MPEKQVRHNYTPSWEGGERVSANPSGIDVSKRFILQIAGKSLAEIASYQTWDSLNFGYFAHGVEVRNTVMEFAAAFTRGDALAQQVDAWVDAAFDQHLSHYNLPTARLIAKSMARTSIEKKMSGSADALLTDAKAAQVVEFVGTAIRDWFPPEIQSHVRRGDNMELITASSNDPDVRAVAAMLLPDDRFHKDVFPQPTIFDPVVNGAKALAQAGEGALEAASRLIGGGRSRWESTRAQGQSQREE